MSSWSSRVRLSALFCAAGLLAGCVSSVPYDRVTCWTAPTQDTAAAAEAHFSAYELRRHGDLGAGTLASGAGEVVLEGFYSYSLGDDGGVYELAPSEPLSAGWAVRFRPDRVEALPGAFQREELEMLVGRRIPDGSVVCALRLLGRFETIQLERHGGGAGEGALLRRVSGMIFGLRPPRAADEMRPAELRLWFLSGDLLTGGPVSDFRLIDGSLALDICTRHLIVNPAAEGALRRLRR